MLYIHRNHEAYWGRGAQDGHLDFHTAPELWLQTLSTTFTDLVSLSFTITHKSQFENERAQELREQGDGAETSRSEFQDCIRIAS